MNWSLFTMSEKAIVYAEDMTDEMMNEAIKTAKNAFQREGPSTAP